MAGAEVKRANPIERFDGPCRVCRSQKGGRGAKKRIQGGIMVEGGFFSFFSLLFFLLCLLWKFLGCRRERPDQFPVVKRSARNADNDD